MSSGLSLSMLAVSGGNVAATAPVVVDQGWIDDLMQIGGTCPWPSCPGGRYFFDPAAFTRPLLSRVRELREWAGLRA